MHNAQDFNRNQATPVHKNVVVVADKIMRTCHAAVAKMNNGLAKNFSVVM